MTNSDLTKCPNCGGPADNGHDRCVPPNPYWCTKCQEIEDKRYAISDVSFTANDMLTNMLMDCAERFGNFADSAHADKRAWEHLLVYAPLDVRFRTNKPNRNPHADMIHEWAETGRKVKHRPNPHFITNSRYKNFETTNWPTWNHIWEYRWADEQPKPDVVITSKVVCVKEGIKTLLSVNDPPNVKYTFDADGKLKNVEMIG